MQFRVAGELYFARQSIRQINKAATDRSVIKEKQRRSRNQMMHQDSWHLKN
jgi:hypothetical protein